MDKEKQMKYYSEILNKFFDSEKQLFDEEAKLNAADSKNEKKFLKTDADVKKAPTRKQLASEVEKSESLLAQARADYDVAKKKVEDLSKKFLKEVDDILNPAEEAVKKAETARYEAIKKFNESFGAYQVTYTGDRAAKEMSRAIDQLNDIQKRFWNDWFRF